MDQIIAEMISTATIAIAMFGIAFCLMQTEYAPVRRGFATFLAAVAVNNAPDAFNRVLQRADDVYVQPINLLIVLSSALCLAPLFWIYVCTLTSSSLQRPARLWRHFLLPAGAMMAGFVVLLSPDYLWSEVVPDDVLTAFGWWTVLMIVIGLFEIAVYPQMAIYLFLIVRRMIRYRHMLRDVYASTEAYELKWIYGIGSLGTLFWLGQALFLAFAFDETQPQPPLAFVVVAGVVSLALVAAMTLWGLRQRPPLIPNPQDRQPTEASQNPTEKQTSDKYEKSALSAEASSRIARKLRAAMENDKLHRDPNLSLWVLARHIGASPNYISQTLNEAMGETFFDFVNGYRIAEAVTRLSTTDDTVLTITYDVGFNARSSFYNAFKRVTGQTPTRYRKNLSQRDGMDDFQDGLRNI